MSNFASAKVSLEEVPPLMKDIQWPNANPFNANLGVNDPTIHHVHDQEQHSRPPPRNRALSCSGADGCATYSHEKKVLVLCFDGTGNKFKGNSGDTNILKIFSMLDRRKGNQYHYYQPGIGTYLTSNAMMHKTARGMSARIKSAYNKAIDAAVGTSFDQHVMGGYKFLMRYYHPGDDIYMFGFSRGAYTARFLCEMLDHVGLVVQGNEEMVHFAWKTFSEWQMRQHAHDEASKRKKEEMYNYMKAFRETFARPVKRVRFLGLFDTVNSVRRFENAWLRRGSRFPYTARSMARVIRHAVGLDERRAKFRLDLVEKVDINEISDNIGQRNKNRKRSWGVEKVSVQDGIVKGPMRALSRKLVDRKKRTTSLGPTGPSLLLMGSRAKSTEVNPSASLVSLNIHFDREEGDDEDAEQDIEEVWFPGAHGDIGGGWDLAPGEPSLAYGPLVWMVREARKAGLTFDERRLKELGCWTALGSEEGNEEEEIEGIQGPQNPTIEVCTATPNESPSTAHDCEKAKELNQELRHTEITENSNELNGQHNQHLSSSLPADSGPQKNLQKLPLSDSPQGTLSNPGTPSRNELRPSTSISDFSPSKTEQKKRDVDERTELRLLDSYTKGRIHCCLTFGGGLPHLTTIGWRMMEYLPIRRMDLQSDGSWKPIIWPLPRGEVRDVPDDAKIHCSVLRRMEKDENYRPGNLLVGGGGRGVRKAPKEYGMGEWVVLREQGSVIGEVLLKKSSLNPKISIA